jgi:hypothetical protein
MKDLDSHFLLLALIRDKYLLHNIKRETNISYTILKMDRYLLYNINDDKNMVDPLKTFRQLGV